MRSPTSCVPPSWRRRPSPAPFDDGGKEDASQRFARKALADFTEAIRLDPGDVAAYYGRSQFRSSLEEVNRAIIDLNEALRLDPENAATYRRELAFCHLERAVR